MPSVDMPLSELVDYRPDRTAREDFDAFWCGCRAESDQIAVNAEFVKVADHLPGAEVYDVAFDGVDGVRVKGWFLTPSECPNPLPTVVQFMKGS
jgi:cephalosporin-C deacetylase